MGRVVDVVPLGSIARITAAFPVVGLLAGCLFLVAGCSDVGDSTAIPSYGTAGDDGGDDASEDAANDTVSPVSDSASLDATQSTDSTMPQLDATMAESDGTSTADAPSATDAAGDATSIQDAPADVVSDATLLSDSGSAESDAEADAREDAAPVGSDGGSDGGEDATAPDSGADAGHDAGRTDAGGSDGGRADAGGSGAPTACTVAPCAASGPNSVTCAPGGNDVCSPTEAVIVNSIDIPKGYLTGGQLNPCDPSQGVCATTASCYACLVNNDCIDNSVNGDTNKECGDLSLSGVALDGTTSYPDACLNIESCFIASGCVTASPAGDCYCGTETGASCQTSPGDGPCLGQVIDGLGDIAGDTCTGTPTGAPTPITPGAAVCSDTATSAPDVFNDFTADTSRPTGSVATLFACAYGNCWPTCQSP